MNLFVPMVLLEKTQVQGIINLLLTAVIMGSVIIVIADAVPKWIAVIRGRQEIIMNEGRMDS
jgi:hypothetical protein